MVSSIDSQAASAEYGLQSYIDTARDIATTTGGHSSIILGRMLLVKALFGLSGFEYGLYGLHSQPLSAIRGYRTKKQVTSLFLKVNPPAQRVKVDDKLLFHRLCEEANLPAPKLLAMLSARRKNGAEQGIDVFPDLASFIAQCDTRKPLDMIVKPRTDALGTGVRFVSIRDGQMFDVDRRPVEHRSFTEELQCDMVRDDYLVQSFVRPHPALATLGSGRALGTFRIVTHAVQGRANILYALFRIPSEGNANDNFRAGASRNLIAGVDLASGVLSTAWGRPRRGTSRLLEAYDRNPETGVTIRGAQVPDWPAICDVVKKAAVAFPELPCLGWDVAPSADGIVIIEANSNPDPMGGQVCLRKGSGVLLRPLGEG